MLTLVAKSRRVTRESRRVTRESRRVTRESRRVTRRTPQQAAGVKLETNNSPGSTGHPPGSTGPPAGSTGHPPGSTGHPPASTSHPPGSTGHPPASTGFFFFTPVRFLRLCHASVAQPATGAGFRGLAKVSTGGRIGAAGFEPGSDFRNYYVILRVHYGTTGPSDRGFRGLHFPYLYI